MSGELQHFKYGWPTDVRQLLPANCTCGNLHNEAVTNVFIFVIAFAIF
jgi:hypothetical protein